MLLFFPIFKSYCSVYLSLSLNKFFLFKYCCLEEEGITGPNLWRFLWLIKNIGELLFENFRQCPLHQCWGTCLTFFFFLIEKVGRFFCFSSILCYIFQCFRRKKGCIFVCVDYQFSQFSSVAQSYLTLCNPMDCSTPGFPVHCQLLELTQTHVHRVSDAIQPSHPLEFWLQHQSFQWIFRTDSL